jgi:hypothetical protein
MLNGSTSYFARLIFTEGRRGDNFHMGDASDRHVHKTIEERSSHLTDIETTNPLSSIRIGPPHRLAFTLQRARQLFRLTNPPND